MTEPSLASWQDENQAYVVAAVARLRRCVERELSDEAVAEEAPQTPWTHPTPPAIVTLSNVFRLSRFETDVLMLCAAIELDASFAALCASARGSGVRASTTFGFALAVLEDGHWSAMAPAAPLRHWHLVQVVSNDGPTQSALRIDERILNYLAGVDHPDPRVAMVTEPLDAGDSLMPSQLAALERIADVWSSHADEQSPVIQIGASEAALATQLAGAACRSLGVRALLLHAHDVPLNAQDRATLARLCEREAALARNVFVLDGARVTDGSPEQRALLALADEVKAPVMLVGLNITDALRRPVIRIDVQSSSLEERRAVWLSTLGPVAASLNGTVERLATHFELPQSTIRTIGAVAVQSKADTATVESQLWESCRLHSRAKLEELADRIEPVADWDDLILPPAQLELLREVAIHVRLRGRIFESWGFGSHSSRATGTCALFAGPSGTGKTLAAEVLANELRLDLYRVDLSRTVSKYIGETEKNLARIFDAGERSGAILLFDEADALFGRRSDVRDSHDRYANIEVSYLLQRMEAFRGGLAILTTNMKSTLDASFWRRLRFVIQFPFPDIEQRTALWRNVFPHEAPRVDLDLDKLARLNITGANIRNIAVNAAFHAADAGVPVGMQHVLWAARQEYAKLDRTLSDAEVRGWT